MVNDVTVELHYSGGWHDITPDVRQAEPVEISWGTKDETTTAAPLQLALTLDNRAGTYSPRNPRSPLFGLIGRNSPIRVRLGESVVSLLLPGQPDDSQAGDAYVSAPDTASLDPAGDIDFRIDLQPVSWRPKLTALARKWDPLADTLTDDQLSWAWLLNPDGTVRFQWSENGLSDTVNEVESTSAVPDTPGRLALRVTLDVDNGSGNHVVRFYTAPTIAGPWTQLGGTMINPGVTDVWQGTAPVEIGRTEPAIVSNTIEGTLYGFEMRDGIDGTVIASPDFTTADAGDQTVTDAQGNVWTLQGRAVLVDPSVRAAAEVTSWPPSWDLSGADVQTPVEAAGILRRLGQGAKPLRSSLFRDLSKSSHVVAYWPLEEGKDAISFASGRAGDNSTLATVGEVTPANYSDFVASSPIPTCELGRIDGNVPYFPGGDRQRFMFICAVPAEGVEGDRILAQVVTFGTVVAWQIRINPTGNLAVRGNDDTGAVLLDSGFSTFAINGKQMMVSLVLDQTGVNTGWSLEVFEVGADTGDVLDGAFLTTYRRIGRVQVGTTGGTSGTNGTAFGHVTVVNNDEDFPLWSAIEDSNALAGWAGEEALMRVARLCREEGIPLRTIGDGSQPVGPQRPATILDLIAEAADVDQAVYGDDRGALRLFYRTGRSLENQTPALIMDYAAGQVASELAPVDDDQTTRNDVTVARTDGSSANQIKDDGPMSVDVIGRYDEEVELNLFSDGQLTDQAGWRLHLGTVDEARYPQITADLTAAPELAAAVEVFAGDRVQITNPPAWLPPETIDQLVRGGTEQLTPYRHLITYNTSPAGPWDVGYIDGDARADTDGSETAAAFTSGTGTALSVAVTTGPLWTTDPAEFPLDVVAGGVRLTVTAIAGASSPQTFTVVAAPVNGVIKTIPVGSDVRLAEPTIAGIRMRGD